MKKHYLIYLFLSSLLLANSFMIFGQEQLILNPDNEPELSEAQMIAKSVVARIEVEKDAETLPPAPKYWTNGVLTQLGLSQVSLTNWAEGGNGQISLNAFVNATLNYKKEKMIWENRIKAGYGFIYSFDEDLPNVKKIQKNDDRFQVDSKWGYQMVSQLYFTAMFNFRTQFAPGYEYPVIDDVTTSKMTSRIMSPGYISLGLGIDYKPVPVFSLNISPLTGNLVVVGVERLREKYGNKINQQVRPELGAQLKADYKQTFGVFVIGTTLTCFYDYLNTKHPEYVQVYWDVDLGVKITKFLTATLRTNLIWDENIRFDITDAKPYGKSKVQFKEILSINFAYTFGQFKKE